MGDSKTWREDDRQGVITMRGMERETYRLRLRTERVAVEGVDDFTDLGFFTLAGLDLAAELLVPRLVRDARVEVLGFDSSAATVASEASPF